MIPLLSQWRKIRTSFTHTPQALKLVWQANPLATVGLAFLTVAGALLPASQAWVGKLIVDGVVASIREDTMPSSQFGFFIGARADTFPGRTAINHSRRLIQQLIQLQLANRIRAESSVKR